MTIRNLFTIGLALTWCALTLSAQSPGGESGSIDPNDLCQETDNLVIDRLEQRYRLVADKSGKRLSEIKESGKVTFKALRHDANAPYLIPYNKEITVDKVSAPDARKSYRSVRDGSIFYDDSKMCVVTFPVKGGKEASLNYEVTMKRPDYFCGFIVNKPLQMNSAKITYEIPLAMRDRFTYTVKNAGDRLLKVDETTTAGEWVVTFTFDTIMAPAHERLKAPSRYWVTDIEWRGLYDSPEEVYADMKRYVNEPDPGKAEVEAFARELTKGCADDASKIKAVNDWVHANIRYIAIEHGDFGRKPDAASEVLRKRYGDCKGSANLIKEMLNAVGVDTRLVWIATTSLPVRWSDLPSMGSGNHMIAAAMTGDSILFIDGTATNHTVGQYPDGIQGQQAMIENGDGCLLIDVPVLKPEVNSLIATTIDYKIDGDNLKGTFNSVRRGSERSILLNTLEGSSAARRSDLLSSLIVDRRKGFRAINPTVTEGPDNTTTLSCELTSPVKRVGSKLRLNFAPDTDLEWMLVDPRKRTTPLDLYCRGRYRTTATLEIPEGYAVDKLPSAKQIATPWVDGMVEYTTSDDGRTLVCTTDWALKELLIPTEDVKEFADQVKSLSRAFNASVTLAPTE